ncbi:S8 family serine peptidase [Streptomyces chartreusis]|uniref:S8 family serine peptidase n=1 Tax=Streptomyces chartreusis TaxID=1969 RepID=A0A7H8T4M3_STRCX|nr:S8 family serine peptidase [Streptomyces chartreusis]QKZ18294.1 S8 family serine peptidase [Streptomyces chartreusis]
MTNRRVTAAVGAALTGLICVLPTAPARAATTPMGWESDALGLSAAQQLSQGEGVTVAVLDTGAVADHPALKGRVTTGPDYRKDGLDPQSPEWGVHGTAMASDVLKVAPKAKILSVRVIADGDKKKADTGEAIQERGASPIVSGIYYAVDHGADVISMSLGSGEVANYADPKDVAAIGYALSHGVTVLAGAGNSGDELNQISFPAGYAGAIAVAAANQSGARADFSTVHTYNELAAPGVGITSARNTGGYEAVDGTSPATALASGVVALMLSHNPKLTPAQTRAVLTRTARAPQRGWNALLGYGQIDAAAAVKAAASPPDDETAPVEYEGKEHFATPVGTSKTTHPAMEQELWLTGLGAAGVGLLMLVGGLFMALRGRRATGPGAAAMASPPGPFQG